VRPLGPPRGPPGARPGLALGLACLGTLLSLLVPAAARPQEPPTLAPFLEELEAAGRRFENVSVAVAEGYRRLGPDFPGMGEHWIHPGLVIAGELDPRRPPALGYTLVEGRRVLVSFAYTRVLGPGDELPAGPFPAGAWHDHTGGVDEESLLLSGPMTAHGGHEAFRLAMVHIWLGVDNPDGTLAQSNWTLPFVRLGLPGPERVTSQAARALSLSSAEGREFYDAMLRDGVRLQGPDLELASRAFDEAARQAALQRERIIIGTGAASEEDLGALEGVWSDLWQRLDGMLAPSSLDAMQVLR
jgi:hypothetical protein